VTPRTRDTLLLIAALPVLVPIAVATHQLHRLLRGTPPNGVLIVVMAVTALLTVTCFASAWLINLLQGPFIGPWLILWTALVYLVTLVIRLGSPVVATPPSA
jgi:hypothetical protein